MVAGPAGTSLRARQMQVVPDDSRTVTDVSFTGNRLFTARDLLVIGNFSLPALYTSHDISRKLQRIIAAYREKGYFFAQVDSLRYLQEDSRTNAFTVQVYVHEGGLFTFGSVKLNGALPTELSALNFFIPPPGTPYRQKTVDRLIGNIEQYYENTGYPYLTAAVSSAITGGHGKDRETTVDVTVALLKNKLVRIDSVTVTGLENTRENVILRESRLRSDALFSELQLRKAREYLQRLAFLEDVAPPELYELPDGTSLVRLTVKERKPNSFSGLVGYVPSEGKNSPGYYVGNFVFDFANLFGTGRVLQAEWNRRDVTSQALRLFYEEPWVAGLPFTVNGQFVQAIQDSSYTKRVFTAGITYRLNTSLAASARFGTELVIAGSAGHDVMNIGNSHGTFYTLGFEYDKRDYRLNPRKGVFYSTFITRQRRRIDISPEKLEKPVYSDTKIQSEFSLAVPIRRQIVAYLRGVWNQTTNSVRDVPASQQWYLGGARSVRGYREKQFRAAKIAWFNAEFRHLLARDSRIFLFLDGGYFQNPQEPLQHKYGYGIGVRVDSRLGLIGFDIGLGTGDTISSAKLHIVVNNSF